MNITLHRTEFDETLGDALKLPEQPAEVPRELLDVLVSSLDSCIELGGVELHTAPSGAKELRLALKFSDRFIEGLAAVRASQIR